MLKPRAPLLCSEQSSLRVRFSEAVPDNDSLCRRQKSQKSEAREIQTGYGRCKNCCLVGIFFLHITSVLTYPLRHECFMSSCIFLFSSESANDACFTFIYDLRKVKMCY